MGVINNLFIYLINEIVDDKGLIDLKNTENNESVENKIYFGFIKWICNCEFVI